MTKTTERTKPNLCMLSYNQIQRACGRLHIANIENGRCFSVGKVLKTQCMWKMTCVNTRKFIKHVISLLEAHENHMLGNHAPSGHFTHASKILYHRNSHFMCEPRSLKKIHSRPCGELSLL